MTALKLNDDAPNLFRGLFTYRIRSSHSPNENFLTEALAYVLACDKQAQVALIKALSGGQIEAKELIAIRTQRQHEEEGEDASACRPDMQIEGIDATGEGFEIWVENKWQARINPEQLRRYLNALGRKSQAAPLRRALVFLSADRGDVIRASSLLATKGVPSIGGQAIAWPDVHHALTSSGSTAQLTREFIAYLDENGLGSLDRITLEEAIDYCDQLKRASSRNRVSVRNAHSLRHKSQKFCAAMLQALQAEDLGVLEEASVDDAWGRSGIISPNYKVSIGLLHDPQDHKTQFLDPDSPLDVFVRIQAKPPGRQEHARLDRHRRALGFLAEQLDELGFECDPVQGGWRGNKHTLLLGQSRQRFPWQASSGRDQVETLRPLFASTIAVLNGRRVKINLARFEAYD